MLFQKLYYSFLLLSVPALLQAAVIPPNPFNPTLARRPVGSGIKEAKPALNTFLKAMFWPKAVHDCFTYEELPSMEEKKSQDLPKVEMEESVCSRTPMLLYHF